MRRWPQKPEREQAELGWFIRDYQKLSWGKQLEIVRKRERPDFLLRRAGMAEGDYGVELTAVYLSDRSVPDLHMVSDEDFHVPDYQENDIANYERRLIDQIRNKVQSAREGYECYPELILAVLPGELIKHLLAVRENFWPSFYETHEDVLLDIGPFTEIVFFNLAFKRGSSPGVFAVRPSQGVEWWR